MSLNGYERVRHPLLIDLVVEEIFRNLTQDALLSSRLVCKQWHGISSIFFKQQKATAFILNCEDIFSFMSTFINCSSPPRTTIRLDFFRIHGNDIELFFNTCSPYIKGIEVTAGNRVDMVSLFSTLLRCASEIHTLTFEGLRELITNQLSRSVSSYLRYEIGVNRIDEFITWYESSLERAGPSEIIFPNLRKLILEIQIEADNTEASFKFFTVMFKMMPRLKEFQVSALDIVGANTTIPGLIRALQQNSAILSQLENLRIDDLDNYGVEQLALFATEYQLRLKKLSLYALMHNVQESAIECVIRSQMDTLEELSIGGQYCRGGNEMRLTGLHWPFVLPKLRVLNMIGGLHIDSHFEYINAIPWNNLEFCRQLPKIQKVGLMFLTKYAMDNIFPDEERTFANPCYTVTKIDFTGGMEAIEGRKIQNLSRLFPNVSDLSVSINSGETITEIFKSNWSKLESLHMVIVKTIYNIDSTFTGISMEPFIASEKQVPDTDEIPPVEFEDFDVNTSCSFGNPSILNLQDLTRLQIEFEMKRQQIARHIINFCISDITGMIALRLMKKLKVLVINRSVITKKCLQILQEELSLEKCAVGDIDGRIINFRDSVEN